jgi:hypothetical protein
MDLRRGNLPLAHLGKMGWNEVIGAR